MPAEAAQKLRKFGRDLTLATQQLTAHTEVEIKDNNHKLGREAVKLIKLHCNNPEAVIEAFLTFFNTKNQGGRGWRGVTSILKIHLRDEHKIDAILTAIRK